MSLKKPLVKANEICVICGEPIGVRELESKYFTPRTRNRFLYTLCNSCRKRVNEERRRLGLQEKRNLWEVLSLYAKARYLFEHGFTELKYYVELMNELVTNAIPNDRLFDEYSSRLVAIGTLEESASRTVTVAERRFPPILEYLEYLKTLEPSNQGVFRAQEKRERSARKLYSKRQSREIIERPVDLLVFDILFDPRHKE